MSKILQVRRGTAAQNNDFTGMAGEITFDTDNKTLRVHDGATLGGFPLARADGGFDISTVAPEFWDNLFAQYGANRVQKYESNLLPLENASYIEALFDFAAEPITVQAFLVCRSPEAGYRVGDMVPCFGVDNHTAAAPLYFVDDNVLHVRQMVGGGMFWVANRDTGIATNIINENWGILFRVYC